MLIKNHFNTEVKMKYSMNYYSKKGRKFYETFRQDPENSVTITGGGNENNTSYYPKKDMSIFQFIVPWQLP